MPSPQITGPVILNGALLRVPIGMVVPGHNARGDLGDLRDLAQSLSHLGQQKPLIVHQLHDGRYELLDGHRRHAAAQIAGLPAVDVILRRDRGPAMRLQQQLALHTHARAFNPMAEARACHTLMFEHSMTRQQIAAQVGRSPLWVRNRISLVHLTEDEQDRVARGELSIDFALTTLAARRAGYSNPSRRKAGTKAATGEARRSGKHCTTCSCSSNRYSDTDVPDGDRG